MACVPVVLATLLTACTKVEQPEPLPEGCSIEIQEVSFTDEDAGFEVTVANQEEIPVIVYVVAQYFDRDLLLETVNTSLQGLLPAGITLASGGTSTGRARITVRPEVPFGPRGFDCVTYTVSTTPPNGRRPRSCGEEAQLCR